VDVGQVLDEVAERPVGAAGDADIQVGGGRDAAAQGGGAVFDQGQQVFEGRCLGHPRFLSPGTDSGDPVSADPLVLQQRFVVVLLGPVRERVRPPLIIGV
jgi:hypothetical protein